MINSDKSSSENTSVWLDSHVHVYDVVDVDALLDKALSNFEKRVSESNSAPNEFVLFITEGINEGAAERLRTAECQHWQIEQGDEPSLLMAINKNSLEKLLLVLGQQLVSEEGIEALVIGSERQEYQPKRPLLELLQHLDQGITILPWGVGKWLGNRGKHITDVFLGYTNATGLFLGDIPARTRLFGGASQITLSKQVGLPALRGGDNLPLSGDEVRVGTFCSKVMVPTERFNRSPVASLLEHLKKDASKIEVEQFGEFLPLTSIIKSQLQLRL